MSDSPNIRNGRITIRLSLELAAKIIKGAKAHAMDVSEYARWILGNELDKVQLTKEDLDWIEEQIAANQIKKANKRLRRKNHGK